ncbi:MAG: membrane protein, partial [Halothiobacillaceae bacterium]
MNPLRRLASQTAIYGLSSIIGRLINYLLVPLFTYTFTPVEYGVLSEFYAYAGFFAVLLIFGLETGYFRFLNKGDHPPALVYSTALSFLLAANITFFGLIYLVDQTLAAVLDHATHPEYLLWIAAILALDSITALGFAQLRAENRAWRFAGIKLVEISITVLVNLFFILYCREAHQQDPRSWAGALWDPDIGIGYIFIANLIATAVKTVLLLPQLRGITVGFNGALFRQM